MLGFLIVNYQRVDFPFEQIVRSHVGSELPTLHLRHSLSGSSGEPSSTRPSTVILTRSAPTSFRCTTSFSTRS
jgi:hypothetical protein